MCSVSLDFFVRKLSAILVARLDVATEVVINIKVNFRSSVSVSDWQLGCVAVAKRIVALCV